MVQVRKVLRLFQDGLYQSNSTLPQNPLPEGISVCGTTSEKRPRSFQYYQTPPQQKIDRDLPLRHTCPDADAHVLHVFMDPRQNLIDTAYAITGDDFHSDYEKFYIELGTLDVDGVHPQATGQNLSVSGLPGRNNDFTTNGTELMGLGKHVAF